MEIKQIQTRKWSLEMTQYEELDPASIWTVILSVSVYGKAASLSGRVVIYDNDPAFVEELSRNELLLPLREAQRLLRRLVEDWKGDALDCGGGGIVMAFDFEQWLKDRYEDNGKYVLGYINRMLQIFD